MMTSIISGAICSSLACSTVTKCCCYSLGISGNSETARMRSSLVYLVLMGLSVFLAVILQYSIAPHLNIKGIWDIGCDERDGSALITKEIEGCKGTLAVYRISFAGAIFSLANALATRLNRNFHSNHWVLKIFGWTILMISSIFIPNSLFGSAFEWTSRVISFLFLLVQIVILIDFSYSWNSSWVEKSESPYNNNNNNKYLAALLCFSSLFYLISLVAICLDVCLF